MNESAIVSVSREGDVAVVAVNSPPVNTITAAVRTGLAQALEQVRAETGLAAVVLRCAGSTFFSGADIGEFSGPPKEEEYRKLFGEFEALDIPVVAAMHGTVMGGGLEIALACHYRVAAPGTRFGFPEVTLGIIPGAGGTQRMPRLIGVEKTLELILTARPVDTTQARALGFVDAEIEGDLHAAAVAYARQLAAAGKGPRRTGSMSVDPSTATDTIIAQAMAQAEKLYPNRTAAPCRSRRASSTRLRWSTKPRKPTSREAPCTPSSQSARPGASPVFPQMRKHAP